MAAVPPEAPPKGLLLLTVEEAHGRSPKDVFTWDVGTGAPFEAFVKVELRGGSRNVKAQSRKAVLVNETITWREELQLEVLEGANELRLMLCREKFQGTKRGTSVIAACGIFVQDILDAVPIDKFFELFKPNNGGEGGFIRVSMNYTPAGAKGELQQQTRGVAAPVDSTAASAPAAAPAATKAAKSSAPKKGGPAKKAVLLTLLAAAGTVAGILLKNAKKAK